MPAFTFTMDTGVVLFIVFQFINVIISTIKSILTVNGSRMPAGVINALSYTFYAVVTKMLTEQPFEVVIPVTFLTNLIGVYVAKWILDKTRKEKLWVIMSTIKQENQVDVEAMLRRENLGYTILPAQNDRFVFTIFSYSKEQSKTIRDILGKFDVKYSIMENKSHL